MQLTQTLRMNNNIFKVKYRDIAIVISIILIGAFLILLYSNFTNRIIEDNVPSSNMQELEGKLSIDPSKPYTFRYKQDLVNIREEKIPESIEFSEFVTTAETYNNSQYQINGIYLYYFKSNLKLQEWFESHNAVKVEELSGTDKFFIASESSISNNKILFVDNTPMRNSADTILLEVEGGVLMVSNMGGKSETFRNIFINTLETLNKVNDGNTSLLNSSDMEKIKAYFKI